MPLLTLRGKVVSGVGEGKIFTNLKWAKRQFQKKLGFQPYPGTLNIQIFRDYKKVKLLKSFKGVEIKPLEGFFGGRCFKAQIMEKIDGAVVIPKFSRYPSNVLEIIAPVNLRKKLNLNDGDEVKVDIWLE